MAEQTTQGTGTETLEVTGGNAKLDARKEIYARAEHGRAAEIAIDREQHASVDENARAFETDDQTRGEDVNTVSEDELLRRQTAEAEGGSETVEAGTDDGAGTGDDPMVDVKVFGQTYQLPKSEVDAKGGPVVVQLLMAADHRMRQATALAAGARDMHTRAQASLAEVERLEKSLRERSSAGGGTPSDQQQQGTTTAKLPDDALRAAVKKTVDVMFKGDAEDAERALTEVLAMIPRGQAAPSTEDVTALVLAKVEAKLFQSQADAQRKQLDTAAKLETDDVNRLMTTKYKAIIDDPDQMAMAQGLFIAARRDPRNKGRSLVSIADDVGSKMLAKGGTAQTETQIASEQRTRTNMKRRLPQPSQTSERASATEKQVDYPTTGKDIVNMMRAARNQPQQ